MLVVLGVTLVGESLNDLADPRLRTRRRAAAQTPADAVAATEPCRRGGGATCCERRQADAARDDGDLAVRIQQPRCHLRHRRRRRRGGRDVSLDVRAGEVLAIVGESGSGKTVTARSILGLLPETASVDGVVLLGKDDIVTVDEARCASCAARRSR